MQSVISLSENMDEFLPVSAVEESTICFAREIVRSWIRSGKKLQPDVEDVKERLHSVFNLDFPDEEVSKLCSEVGLVSAASA